MNDLKHRRRGYRATAMAFAVGAAMTVSMLTVERFDVAMLTRPDSWQNEVSMGVALLSIGLLTSDVVLPIPSSLVLIGNGAVFGALLGTVISVIGLVAGSLLGYALGRLGGPAAQRLLGQDDAACVRDRFSRHGPWLVAACRVLPIASETTSLLAGATRLRGSVFLACAALGSIAVATPLAMLGDGAISARSFVLVAAGACSAGGAAWVASRRRSRYPDGSSNCRAATTTGAADGLSTR